MSSLSQICPRYGALFEPRMDGGTASGIGIRTDTGTSTTSTTDIDTGYGTEYSGQCWHGRPSQSVILRTSTLRFTLDLHQGRASIQSVRRGLSESGRDPPRDRRGQHAGPGSP